MDKQGEFHIADSWSIGKGEDASTAQSNAGADSLTQLEDNYIKRNVLPKQNEDDNIAISSRLQQRLIKNFNPDIFKSMTLSLN